jgi:nitrate/nitrite-specific signal transduction histidine kinase
MRISSALATTQAGRRAGADRQFRVLCMASSAIVEDDGIGIRKMAGAHHYGMTIMEERAKNLGGTLTVDRPATAGTRVTLPLWFNCF